MKNGRRKTMEGFFFKSGGDVLNIKPVKQLVDKDTCQIYDNRICKIEIINEDYVFGEDDGDFEVSTDIRLDIDQVKQLADYLIKMVNSQPLSPMTIEAIKKFA